MTTILSRKSLKSQVDHYVMVQRDNCIYQRLGEEYVAKQYFDISEAMTILQMDKNKIHRLCAKLGIQARANRRKKIKITLKQLRQMATL